MKDLYSKYNLKIEVTFKVLVSAYFLLSFYYFFIIAEISGDETLFLNDLVFIKTNGWIAAIEKSISIPYMMLVYPFSFFLKEYLALKTANIFLLLLLLLYFFKIAKIKASPFYFYLFFFLATSKYFFAGTNDALFFTGLVIFMTEVFYFIANKKINNQGLAFSGLIISFFTREMFLVYLPVVLLGLYFLYKNGFSFFNKKRIFSILIFFFFMGLNAPSLKLNHKLSYDDKTPSSEIKVSWSQRQYLAQLLVNKGELQNFSHPSWEQTQEYLKKNGLNSLPNGIVEGLTFDYSLTVKEFFKDFYYSMFFGLRQLGFILLFPFYFILTNLKKKNILNPEMFIPYSLIVTLCVFSLIIISYIEPRWYIAVFISAIVFYNQYQVDKRINPNFIIANYLVFICFSFLGIYSILHKFMRII
ncbi:hypothetical protein [Flavobacterium sp. 120]|uniref:hypothetical protein n=1 Tax=Flavobacterium sp. 120 TaxID=2135626 RepID=UPI000EAB5F5D|nr:hypothetical protein [Flavobacterium sp. 120]RKS13376.1 hypothetical protein C8C87_0586 [Flavobacterium sp. 120]